MVWFTSIERELLILASIFTLSMMIWPFGPALVIGVYIGIVNEKRAGRWK